MNRPEHKIIPVTEGVWCISEYKLVNAFVVEGETGLLLIDTGCGIGDLPATLGKISQKPVKNIILTHNHFDHNGGLYHFPDAQIYMHSADHSLAEAMLSMSPDGSYNGLRDFYIRTRGPVRCPEYSVDSLLALIPPHNPDWRFDYTALHRDTRITTDGRSLKVIHTPGHTDGSICLLDTASRLLFSGDTVNNSIILMRQPDNDTKLIKQFNETVRQLWALSEEYDSLAIGHDGTIIDKAIVKDYLDLTDGLLNGSITGEYQETGFRKGDVARLGKAELWYQCDA